MKVVVEIKAGLGNQMFCYALGYAVAKEKNAEYYIDTSLLDQHLVKNREYELAIFNLEYDGRISYRYDDKLLYKKTGINRIRRIAALGFGTKKYKEKEYYSYDAGVFQINCDTVFDGYWQNYRYFDKYREQLLKIFQLNIERDSEVVALERRIKEVESVSLHVRRGDYLGLNWQLPMDYYDNAIEKLCRKLNERRVQSVVIVLFSDDLEFVKNYFSQREKRGITYIYADYSSDRKTVYDLYLMSQCRHNIIANSSYSWWGAYLNQNPDKTVICPVIGNWTETIYPVDWSKVIIEG